jgi:retron-type reverse transcriptase
VPRHCRQVTGGERESSKRRNPRGAEWGRPQGRSLPGVIDLDVASFFDSVPWDLMVKAVQANITTGQKWVLLYVRRLAAPLQRPDGTLEDRDRGTLFRSKIGFGW